MAWGAAVVAGCLRNSPTDGSVSWQTRHCSGSSALAKTFCVVCLPPPRPAAATLRKACMGKCTDECSYWSN